MNGYGKTTDSNYQDITQTSGPNNYLYYDNTGSGTGRARLLGVWLGQLPRDPVTYPTHTINVLPIQSPGEPQMTFVLQYLDSGGSWRPYSVMARVQEINCPPYDHGEAAGFVTAFALFAAAHIDPRTDRFSASMGEFDRTGTTHNYDWGGGTTIRCSNLSNNSTDGGGRGGLNFLMPSTTAGFSYRNPLTGSPATAYLLDDWQNNQKSPRPCSMPRPTFGTRTRMASPDRAMAGGLITNPPRPARRLPRVVMGRSLTRRPLLLPITR